MIDGMDELRGCTVCIRATGETGVVTGESFGLVPIPEDEGIARKHQLVVKIISASTCPTCPHWRIGAVTHLVAVDACDVTLVGAS